MRFVVLSLAMSLCIAPFAAGCGSTSTGFGTDGGTSTDGTVGTDGNPIQFPDSGTHDGGCVNLQCKQTCATTSISGTVYDPAGDIGLYNVFVYVPNAPLDPIPDGPTCTQCQAPASGNPVVSATTDANGHFTIPNAPDGDNIPIVIQLGKWRRHLVIPHVTACVDNPQTGNTLRFPRKQHETSPDDNIPLIAFTTGCDAAECFFKSRLGIDSSEFTGSSGTGRVRIYKSTNDDGQTFPSLKTGDLGADQLWNNSGEMMKYDIVFDACECQTFTRGANGYKNFLAYLNAGGRAFSTHFFYNFFANQTQCSGDTTCNGQTPLPTVASWEGNQGLADSTVCKLNSQDNSFNSDECLTVDTAIPKGKAFADWYKANNAKLQVGGGEPYGYLGLTDIRTDMGALSSSLVSAGTETPWLYAHGTQTFPTNYDAYYMSVNTPVGTDSTNQCGRAVFSDVHLSGYLNGTFPGYCAADPNTSDHAPDELALEFLFFDLASCVQNDTQQPVVPH